MERQPGSKGTGLLIKDEMGELYYVRPEILEMCKVAPEDTKAHKGMDQLTRNVRELQQAVQSEQLATGFAKEVDILGSIKVEKALEPSIVDKINAVRYSTVMCPW